MSASAAAAIQIADVELHCCPSIEASRRESASEKVFDCLRTDGRPLELSTMVGCRVDMIYGIISDRVDRNRILQIALAIRDAFGSGYTVHLVSEKDNLVLYENPSTS